MEHFDMAYEGILRRIFNCYRHSDDLGLADADVYRRVKHHPPSRVSRSVADLRIGLAYSLKKVHNDIVSGKNKKYNKRYFDTNDEEFRGLVDNLEALYIRSVSTTKLEGFKEIIEKTTDILDTLNIKRNITK